MNLNSLLHARADAGAPVRVGVIGAGKFGSMFLSQALHHPGFHVVGVADLNPATAEKALLNTGWPKERITRHSVAHAANTAGQGNQHAGPGPAHPPRPVFP